MQNFSFHRPGSVAEALSALRGASEGKFLGGGQSLLPLMKLDLAEASDVIAVANLPELQGVAREGDAFRVGAATTHAQVAEASELAGALPALAELAATIGDAQVRNRGTLGGSIAHADPAADYPAAVVALGATVVTDRREIPGDEFFRGLYETALEEDELVTAVRFPIPEQAAYGKFPHPASKFPLAGVFVARRAGGEVRVAVTGASSRVFRVEAFESALRTDFRAEALDGLAIPAEGLTDNLDASAEYRAHLVGVMARRAVAAAATRG